MFWGAVNNYFTFFRFFYMRMTKSQLVSCLAPPFFPCPSSIIPCSPAAVCIKINRCRSQLFLSFHTTGARIVCPRPFTIFQGKMPLSACHAGRWRASAPTNKFYARCFPCKVSNPIISAGQNADFQGNTAQFPPSGLSTASAAAARHLRCQNAR